MSKKKKGALLGVALIGVLSLILIISFTFSREWECGDPLHDKRDGEIYRTTKIGEQCFMAENLSYRAPGGSWCYNDDERYCEEYGRLYSNATAQKACPDGWHLPSDKEWEELEIYLGMIPFDTGRPGWRVSGDVGDKLKSSLRWDGSNSYGFNGLPGGYRLLDGSYYGARIFGRWWTSTTSEGRAWRRHLDPKEVGIFRSIHDVNFGYSVRCIKTEE